MSKTNRVKLAKIDSAERTWGGNGFGTTSGSARYRVVLDGVETGLTLQAAPVGFMEPAPDWNLTAQSPSGNYRLVRRFLAPLRGGGAARTAKTWIRENPALVERLIRESQGLGRSTASAMPRGNVQ